MKILKTMEELLNKTSKKLSIFAQTYQNINAYDTSIKELEDIPCIQELMKDIYGYLDVMAGVCNWKK